MDANEADTMIYNAALGDVRLNSDKHGVWGKYIGGKSKRQMMSM